METPPIDEVKEAWQAIQRAHRFHCCEIVRRQERKQQGDREAKRHYGRKRR